MLKIWKNCDEIRDKHFKYCKEFVKLRIIDAKVNGLAGNTNSILIDLLDYADKKLSNILIGTIDELKGIHRYLMKNNALYRDYGKKKNVIPEKVLKKVFDYKYLCNKGLPLKGKKEWDAYKLVKALGLITCPYCNEHTIHTVYKKNNSQNTQLKGKVRAELDHFFPQYRYPLFALSFYNLIPVCRICNRLKSTEIININPHEDYFRENDCFRVEYDSDYIDKHIPIVNECFDNFEVVFDTKTSTKRKQIKTLFIEDRYSQYKDIINDVKLKNMIYNSACRVGITSLIPGLSELSQTDIIRIIYNVSNVPEEYHTRPLSKLINDILKQVNEK